MRRSTNGEEERRGWTSSAALALVVVLVVGGVALVVFALPGGDGDGDAAGEPTATDLPGPASPERDDPGGENTGAGRDQTGETRRPARFRPSRPEKVTIGAIDVSSRLMTLGLQEDGTLEVPSDYDRAGWWAGGPRPGERGAAVIVGHVDGPNGAAVFFRLGQMRRGQKVSVTRRDGSKVSFVVQRTRQVGKDDFPTKQVYTRGGPPTLRLITCSGPYDRNVGEYTDNTIVFLKRA